MTARGPRPRRRSPRGATLAALMGTVAVMSILMTVAAQQWSFVVRRELEKELIHRGERIQLAIWEYGTRTGAPPLLKLEELTKRPRPLLPGVPPDPMTARYDAHGKLVEGTGEWHVLRLVPQGQPLIPGQPAREIPSSPIRGVRSKAKDDLLSIGAWGDVPPGSPYSAWEFVVSQTGGGGPVRQVFVPQPQYPPGFGGLRLPGGPPIADTRKTPQPSRPRTPTDGPEGGPSG
jgi:hypothetical protein